MGGNALGACVTRIQRADYERVAPRVLAQLREALPGHRVEVIPAYRNKADFGDLDILVSSDGADENSLVLRRGYLERISAELFNATTVFRPTRLGTMVEGHAMSFDFRETPTQALGLQVDIILQPAHAFGYGMGYFGYNDLGNLTGRIAEPLGFRHTHAGIKWYLTDGTLMFREICVTTDHQAGLEFLGFDYARYREGFDELSDIFEYVTSSPFFYPASFLLENRNNAARTRDRKRSTYRKFLSWLDENGSRFEGRTSPGVKFGLDRAFEYFPQFKLAYVQGYKDLADMRTIQRVFNGELVSKLTGLKGKELGARMTAIRASFDTPEVFKQFLLQSSSDEIRARILMA